MNNLSCGQRNRLLCTGNTIAHNKKLWANLKQKSVCESQRADHPMFNNKKQKCGDQKPL